ncbi:transcriptional regulator PadR-like protein (plasmid) [Rhizobium gallicum]|uniref:Transcriptional regulator PadR-like protein n=1 Tax=Rhizobium gallicum TaxID=56730 RepID=A0A1L5NUF9_9HYPH|nr:MULTISPECIES: PadR family transcriptional regulator [Rhizobium]APO71508.1 transcriptional regulator PadR-like protein [Rhizobium gallicum]QPB23247.1 helix-turn-helix transcriptional regulator [Rhizobium sp. 007]
MEYQDLLSGFIRLHVLHHAAEGDLHGLWMIEELARHGYKVSAGTLYPMLHSLEKKGYLASRIERVGRTRRRIYNATPYGLVALEKAKEKAKELFREILPDSSA